MINSFRIRYRALQISLANANEGYLH